MEEREETEDEPLAKDEPIPVKEPSKTVSFELEGKRHWGEIVNDSIGNPEVELYYTSEVGEHFKTGTKISVASDQLQQEAFNSPTRKVKNWVAQAPISDTKQFEEIKDENGVLVDYKNVTFKGYASTNENTTSEDRIGDYLKEGAFKKTIKHCKCL